MLKVDSHHSNMRAAGHYPPRPSGENRPSARRLGVVVGLKRQGHIRKVGDMGRPELALANKELAMKKPADQGRPIMNHKFYAPLRHGHHVLRQIQLTITPSTCIDRKGRI